MTDRTVVYRLQADAQQFKAQMAAASASVKKAADDMTGATKEGAKFRQGLDSLGGTAGKVGLVAAAGLGAAIKKAADFDSAMSKVQAATHESAAAMDDLRQAALDAGAQTAFSATEAAAGIENLAKAGVSTADILNGGLAGALDLAAAGEMEVAAAAEAAAGAMAQFKLEGDQVPHIADLMAAAAGKAQGEVSDMVMALKQGGTVAAQTGLSIEETTASFAALAEQSLLGSDAGTSFKTMLASLTPNSKKAADAMEQYNINAFDAQGNFVGMTELAGQLRAGLGDLTDEQRSMALETIFGSDAVRAASIIYDNGAEGIANWTEKVNDAGYAAETAAIKQDNLRGDLEKLGGALETALIGTGSSSQGPLRALTQSLESAVNAYNDLGEGAKSGVAVTLAATAGIGGGLFVFSKMVQSIAATRAALEALGVTATSTQGMVTTAAKGMGVGLAAGLAVAAGDLFDVDYSLDSMNRQLEVLAAQGDAKGVLEGLSMSADTLGEALRDAAFNDFNMFGMGAAAEIEELDNALAGLDPTVAAETFKVLIEEGTRAGLTVAEVKELFPQYAAELKLAAKESDAATDATKGLADAHPTLTKRMANAKAMTEAQAKALKQARDAAGDTATSFVNLGDDVDSAKVSLGQWIAQLGEQADALNNFMNNAKAASKRGLRDGLIKDLQDAGPAGALRMKQLANATDEEIARANRAWARGQQAIQDYINFKVPPKTIEVNNGRAMSAIDALEAKLRAIKDEDVFVNVRRIGATTMGPRMEADGGHITGPGTATSDSIPAYLSNGEYVIKAAAVDKYGVHMFDRLNAMHFAGGGSVDKGKKAQEAREKARRAAEERRRREEEARQRRLEAQRVKALLASDLNNEVQQAALEVQDAQRRLQSARKAGRPKAEIREAQLALKQERTDRRSLRDRMAEEAEAERTRITEEAEAERVRLAEEAAERQRQHDEAVFAGHERAWDQATDAAKSQQDAAKAMVESVQQNMDRIGQAATSMFSGSWFSGGGQDHGLWVGNGAGDWRSKAMDSIAGLQQRSALISQLSGLGLTGAALEDLLGNQSNSGIAAMIGAGEIDDFAALFAQRQSLLTSVGSQAGQAGYGSEMAAASAALAAANSHIAALTAAIQAARPINILQQTTEQAAAMELARILSMTGGA